MPTTTDRTERAELIRVDGIVQGVGFRPAVYRLAVERGLRGLVRNEGSGVTIVVAGEAASIDGFVRGLARDAPPLARIDRIERQACATPVGDGFRIDASVAGPARLALAADTAVCPACLAETRDTADRRYRHPFANCTSCGPRLSIVRKLPYDRARTSMADFALCADCRREFDDPADRRFHAQPIACPQCGPALRSTPGGGVGEGALQRAIDALRAGGVVAVKGIGGYQLACDAGNDAAVRGLRERKRRPAKPFALLARDVAMVERYCRMSPIERDQLESRAAPIVLLCIESDRQPLAPSIAPRLRMLGFMLPSTPLHHMLMQALDRPIVLTSGNLADDPQCIDDGEAFERLAPIADVVLWHDRPIVNRVDDSVVRVAAGATRVVRLGRGLAPAAFALAPGFARAPDVLALGGELKNTICLLHAGQAIVSQHIGDLGHPRADAALRETISLYGTLFEHRPAVIVVDRHPDQRAARIGHERVLADAAERDGDQHPGALGAVRGPAVLDGVQHHHAHIAACLAEHQVAIDAPPVLGIALDGLGYGDDGTWWGGEFLLADYRQARRVASFAPVCMPGGMQAIREPWRMTWAYLVEHGVFDAMRQRHAGVAFFRRLDPRRCLQLAAMRAAGINVPLTTSCGRLFDAVAALLDLCTESLYEGQPAIELEACVDAQALRGGSGYAFAVSDDSISTAPLWPALLEDVAGGVSHGVIAARFHLGLADAITALALRLTTRHADPWQHRIAFGGGVFQNAVLLDELTQRLLAAGFTVWSPGAVPTNDGGLALGQAMVAAARCLASGEEIEPCASASRPA